MGPTGFNKDLNDPAVPGIKGVGFMGGDILLGGPAATSSKARAATT